MPVFTSSIEVTADYPTIKPSLNLNFARARALDPRITFTRASVGTYVGRDGLIKTAGNNEARFDHDPETLESLGLLIEESSTNEFPFSEDFSSFVWTKVNTTVTTNAATSPDGTSTADRLQIGTTNGIVNNNIVGPVGSNSTVSMWVKAVTPGTDNVFRLVSAGDLSADLTATDKWVRYSFTSSTNSTGIHGIARPSDNTAADVYVWGAQFEEGKSFPTSYFPTNSGAILPRAADDAKITGETFADWYNPLESTIFFESGVAPTSNSKYFTFRGDDGGGTELIESAAVSGPGANVFTYCDSSIRANISVTDSGATKLKYATGVIKDNVNIAVNGTLGTADTSAVHPDGINQLSIGNYSNGSYYLNNTIQKLTYYPKRLTDAQLQLLTS